MFARLIVHSPQVLMASPAHRQHGNQELTHGRDRPVGLKRTQAFFACRAPETLPRENASLSPALKFDNLFISGNNRPKTFTRLRQANLICPGPLEIYPAPYLFLSKRTRKGRKRKKRKVKENEARKEAPTKMAENINTTIYTN